VGFAAFSVMVFSRAVDSEGNICVCYNYRFDLLQFGAFGGKWCCVLQLVLWFLKGGD